MGPLWRGNGNPLQYSCLENPTEEKPGRLQSMGSQRVGHDWVNSLTHLHIYIFWLHLAACRVLVLWSGVEPWPSVMKVQRSNHWTTREFQIKKKNKPWYCGSSPTIWESFRHASIFLAFFPSVFQSSFWTWQEGSWVMKTNGNSSMFPKPFASHPCSKLLPFHH